MISFLEWLMKENPDHLSVDGEYVDRFDDSLSFLSMGGFAVYSGGFNVIHRDMIILLRGCEDKIRAASEGASSSMDAWLCIEEHMQAVGALDSSALKIMVSLLDLLDEVGTDGSRLNRTLVMRWIPDLIWGRMWPKLGVVSFWNGFEDLKRNKEHILKVVGLIGGDDKKFRYEVGGKLLDRASFVSGNPTPNPDFDPSKLHTMIPGPAKEMLMSKAGVPKSRFRTDFSTKMKTYTDEGA